MSETLIIDENRIFAPVQVGQTAGYAHLDTGARYSAITQSYATGLPKVGVREYRGSLGKSQTEQVRIEEFSFLGKTYHDIVVDVKPDVIGDLDSLPFAIIMALGSDTLLQSPLQLDCVNNRVGFVEGIQVANGVHIDADFAFLGMPFFQVAVGARILRALFDTGAGMSVLNQRLLAELGDEITQGKPLEVEDATGAKHVIPTFECPTLSIGDEAFGKCQVLAIDPSHAEREIDTQIDFVFGVNAMMGRKWLIDRHNQSIEMID